MPPIALLSMTALQLSGCLLRIIKTEAVRSPTPGWIAPLCLLAILWRSQVGELVDIFATEGGRIRETEARMQDAQNGKFRWPENSRRRSVLMDAAKVG